MTPNFEKPLDVLEELIPDKQIKALVSKAAPDNIAAFVARTAGRVGKTVIEQPLEAITEATKDIGNTLRSRTRHNL